MKKDDPLTLTALLTEAFTAIKSPEQGSGAEYSPKKHGVPVAMPLAAQHLHTTKCQLAAKGRADVEAYSAMEDGSAEKEIEGDNLAKLAEKTHAVSNLVQALIEEVLPGKADLRGYTILNGWQVASLLSTPDDTGKSDLFAALDSLVKGGKIGGMMVFRA